MRQPLLLLLATVIGCTQPEPSAPDGPAPEAPFQIVLDRHLDAIHRHDLEALIPTLTTSDSLTLIFPDGTLIETREAFLDIHREWFADTTWTMIFEPVAVQDGEDIALAVVMWTLRDDSPRSGRQALLSLGFRVEDGAWRLFHDQNTSLPLPSDAE